MIPDRGELLIYGQGKPILNYLGICIRLKGEAMSQTQGLERMEAARGAGQGHAHAPPPEPGSLPVLLTDAQVGDFLGMSRRTIRQMDTTGRLPQGLKLGRLRRWRRDELADWVKSGCPGRARWRWKAGK